MSALKKGVAFSVGLVTANCSINGAVEKAPGNKNVCCGTNGNPEHVPIPISQVNRCSTCGDVAYTDIRKAREVPGGLVLLEEAEIAEAKGDADTFKTRCAMTPHPAVEVYARTAPGEKVYYVTPDPGNEVPYAVLCSMISAHPEFAFVCQWTPRTNASQFRVTVRDGVLCMTELVRSQALKPVPQVEAEAPEAMLAMAEQVLQLPGVVTAYDPDTYADHYEDNIQALLAQKQVVSTGGTVTSTPAPSVPAGQKAAMDALAAMLEAAKPAPKKRAKAKASA